MPIHPIGKCACLPPPPRLRVSLILPIRHIGKTTCETSLDIQFCQYILLSLRCYESFRQNWVRASVNANRPNPFPPRLLAHMNLRGRCDTMLRSSNRPLRALIIVNSCDRVLATPSHVLQYLVLLRPSSNLGSYSAGWAPIWATPEARGLDHPTRNLSIWGVIWGAFGAGCKHVPQIGMCARGSNV